MNDTAEEILARAADLVERPDGWCQHKLRDGMAFCLSGAIEMAMRPGGHWLGTPIPLAHQSRSRVEVLRAVQEEVGTPNLASWNDAPGRTAVEVATALRNAKRFL